MVSRSDRPQKTALLIAKKIVSDIERQGVYPGDRLASEKTMLEGYQVGRGTLRESLRYLELSGVLSFRPGPGGGPILERPDASNLMNSLGLLLQFNNVALGAVVEARIGVEPLMARHAAVRRTEEQLAHLTDNVAMMDKNLDDLTAFLRLNQKFHDLVAWASGNALLGFLVEALDGIYEVFAHAIDYSMCRRRKIHEAHTAVLEAITVKDPDFAAELMRTHVTEMADYLESQFPESFSQAICWQDMR